MSENTTPRVAAEAQRERKANPMPPSATTFEVVLAILLPIIGIIRGLIEMRKRPRAAWQQLGVGAAAIVVWSVLLR